MPIKIYERRVGPTAGPSVRQRVNPGGQGLAQIASAVGGLAGEVGATQRVFEQARAKQDNAVQMGWGASVAKVDQTFSEEMMQNDGERGLEWAKDAAERYEKEIDAHYQALPQDRHREALRAARDNAVTAFRSRRAQFADKRADEVHKVKFQGLMTSTDTAAAAAAAGGDELGWRNQVAAKQIAIDSYAETLGIPEEALQAFEQEQMSPMIAGVIDSYLQSGDVEAAKSIFEEHRFQVTKETSDVLSQQVSAASAGFKVRGIVNDLVADNSDAHSVHMDRVIEGLQQQNLSASEFDAGLAHAKKLDSLKRDATSASDGRYMHEFKRDIMAYRGLDKTNPNWAKLSPDMQDDMIALQYRHEQRQKDRVSKWSDDRSKVTKAAWDALDPEEKRNPDTLTRPPFSSADELTSLELQKKHKSEIYKGGVPKREYENTYSEAINDKFRGHTQNKIKEIKESLKPTLDRLYDNWVSDDSEETKGPVTQKQVDEWVSLVGADFVTTEAKDRWFPANFLGIDKEKKFHELEPEDRRKAINKELRRSNEEAKRGLEEKEEVDVSVTPQRRGAAVGTKVPSVSPWGRGKPVLLDPRNPEDIKKIDKGDLESIKRAFAKWNQEHPDKKKRFSSANIIRFYNNPGVK